IRSSRITSMFRSSSLLDHVGQQPEVAGTLDGAREFALLFCRHGRDAARNDLAALGNEAAEQLYVLIVDLRRVRAREGARLAAAEERPARCAAPADDFNAHGLALPARTAVTAGTVAPATTATVIASVLVLHHRRRFGIELRHADGEVA